MRIAIGTFFAVLFLAAWLPPLTSASPSNRSSLSAAVFTSSSSLHTLQLHRHRTTRRAGNYTTRHHDHHGVDLGEEEEVEEEVEERGGTVRTNLGFKFGARMGIKQMQQMLMREGRGIDCCPSKEEMTTPDGGRTRDGRLVSLFKEEEWIQTFYEQTCLPGVEDKPCYFLDRRMHNQSKCVQKHSYTYAIVLNPEYSEGDSDEGGGTSNSVSLKDVHSLTAPNSKWMMDYIRVNSGCACEVQPKHRRKKHEKSKKTKNKRVDSD